MSVNCFKFTAHIFVHTVCSCKHLTVVQILSGNYADDALCPQIIFTVQILSHQPMTVVYHMDPPSYKYAYKTNDSKRTNTNTNVQIQIHLNSARQRQWCFMWLRQGRAVIRTPRSHRRWNWVTVTGHNCPPLLHKYRYKYMYKYKYKYRYRYKYTHNYKYKYTCMYKCDCKSKYKDGSNDRQNCITVIWQNWSTVSIPEKARLSQWKWLSSGFWPPWYFIHAAYFGFCSPNYNVLVHWLTYQMHIYYVKENLQILIF